MWSLILSTVLAASPSFEARGEGPPVVGSLEELTPTGVTLSTSAGARLVAAAQLEVIEPRQAPSATGITPGAWVELTDGSLIVGESFTANDRTFTVALGGGRSIEAPIGSAAEVRFQEFTGSQLDQWRGIVEAQHEGDSLVVRSDASIDYLDGVLESVSPEAVAFNVNGERHTVQRAKVAALLYAKRPNTEPPAPFCTVHGVGGTRLKVIEAKIDGTRLSLKTPAGALISWPQDRIASIEFRVQYLSDFKPDAVTITPYLGSFASLSPAAAAYCRPRFNAEEGSPLSLGGRAYRKGMALVGKSELIYRLPGKFAALKALVGIDDSVRPLGDVTLTILGDDRLLAESRLTGQDQPLELNVDLQGVERLRIQVDFNGVEVGDLVNICDPRMIP